MLAAQSTFSQWSALLLLRFYPTEYGYCTLMISRCSICLALALLVFGIGSAEETVDFNRDIRPLISNNCLMCHGPDEEARSTELRLDTQEGSRIDLGGYSAIVPGDPDSSEILERLVSEDPDVRMPPEGKGKPLSDSQIQLIRRWIAQGADYAKHWSYEKPIRPELPTVSDTKWPREAIDHFILARLDHLGLKPSPEADRMVLARRLSMDLLGLPPTYEEAVAFANDSRPEAYELYVDGLMDRPAFGERWARVWLDLARYADSAGYADDPPRTIWAFRDYVIKSLNNNKPFDQFTIEQIAGDLLENPTDEQLIATAFHRNTLTNNEGGTNDEEFRNVAIVDRVNTTMAVWMGTTMACAQCHSHKYDPITQHEYFEFFAFFNNSEDSDKRDERPTLPVWTDEQNSLKQELSAEIEALKKTLETETDSLKKERATWLASLQKQPLWKSLQPASAQANQRTIEINEDGWVAGVGDKPETDVYTVSVPTTGDTITGVKLDVAAEQQSNFVLSQVNGRWIPDGKQGIGARYVRIELPGKGKMIHVAEVQAFSGSENVALKGKASQSSTDFGGNVEYANDGNTDGNFNGKSVTHTAIQENPWLEIDLGSTQSIDQVAIWNRTDGGAPIVNRIAGYKVLLLDEAHQPLWEQTPKEVPNPKAVFNASGAIQLNFSAAFADFEQSGFPASSTIGKLDTKKGWAIAGQTQKPHELTLLLGRSVKLGAGTLEFELHQSSVHPQHLLDKFRLSVTSDNNISQWARMPAKIRTLIQSTESLDQQQMMEIAAYHRSIAPSLAETRGKLASAEKRLKDMKPSTTVPIMRELAEKMYRKTKVQVRGNYKNTTDEVTQATPAVFHPLADDDAPPRLRLAHWLVNESNPLTARVIANRHWEQIFGIGIVETSEEFGSQGELPTHPALLDWLAVELQEKGWNIKQLLKSMVMSATYRQSSVTTNEQLEADPFNRMYARGPRFRISAEMVRDQALFVSGLLSDKMYGPPVRPPQPNLGLTAAFGSTTDWKTSDGDDKHRRGIYTTWRRSNPYPSMATFDAPNREVCTIRRSRTNTPLQALVTLNDPVYVEAAQSLARRILKHEGTPVEQIEYGFQNALIRKPNARESQRLVALFQKASELFQDNEADAKMLAGMAAEGNDIATAAAMTVVGNVILNLDEMFMKR